MDKQYINIKEASEILGVSKLTLRNWDRDGKLSALRHPISNYRVYKVEDLKGILDKMESGEKPTILRKRGSSSPSRKKDIEKTKTYNLKDLLSRE
ncbi:TPA: hypothetical protein DD445_02990 [Candidatus Nomurabacteria bacterium]|nr:hypothetical protein [Candidatus Nomurabacteria bacterium]HBP27727.1 hypothetical protein [Candidatus Nomurabacteria bacterium]HBR66015.1 hypothetical protein [Candidatus Nomurabacteria bacterium]